MQERRAGNKGAGKNVILRDPSPKDMAAVLPREIVNDRNAAVRVLDRVGIGHPGPFVEEQLVRPCVSVVLRKEGRQSVREGASRDPRAGSGGSRDSASGVARIADEKHRRENWGR